MTLFILFCIYAVVSLVIAGIYMGITLTWGENIINSIGIFIIMLAFWPVIFVTAAVSNFIDDHKRK